MEHSRTIRSPWHQRVSSTMVCRGSVRSISGSILVEAALIFLHFFLPQASKGGRGVRPPLPRDWPLGGEGGADPPPPPEKSMSLASTPPGSDVCPPLCALPYCQPLSLSSLSSSLSPDPALFICVRYIQALVCCGVSTERWSLFIIRNHEIRCTGVNRGRLSRYSHARCDRCVLTSGRSPSR